LRLSHSAVKIVTKSIYRAFARRYGVGRMYAFLLVLGAAITAAGLALVASGVSLQDRAFDVSNATPGIVAFVGGCILIGLGLVVRALARVERALATKPMLHVGRSSETPADTSTEHATEPRIPLPTETKAAATEATAPSVAPSSERIETALVVDGGDVSLLPNPPARPDDGNGVADPTLPKVNGAAHAAAPRAASGPARPQQPKSSIFDTLWPKAPRSATEARPAAVQPAAAGPAAHGAEPAPSAAPPPAAATQTSAGVSILKSGVVEGMAYTLYSDGSIEAQLPGGTLRFRSITELRSHIEQNG
jgi:hypothetical protein